MDLGHATLFVTLAGSQAHGTAGPESDLDLRGVCVVPLRARVSYREVFEQIEGPLPDPLWEVVRPRLEQHPAAWRPEKKVESVIFDIAKLVRLCAAANPNALEIAFADDRDVLFDAPPWRILRAARDHFLSAKVRQTYVGYALAQLKKIKMHRAWLLSPPTERPTRAAFGLPDGPTLERGDRHRIDRAVADKLRGWGVDELEMPPATRIALDARLADLWSELTGLEDVDEGTREDYAARSLGLPAGLIDALGAERRYRTALRQWESFQRWKRERNPHRAKLEAAFGYDTKHAMHLVRLLRTGLEILERQTLSVRREDAAELVAIREGALSYEALVQEAARLDARIEQAAQTTSLPADVDHELLDGVLFEVIVAHERGGRGCR
jgi:uncharacterized protein